MSNNELHEFERGITLQNQRNAHIDANSINEIPSSWARLAKGATLGKRIVIPFTGGFEGINSGTLNILQVMSDDNSATQLAIVLSCPTVLRPGITLPMDVQNISGQQTNIQLGTTVAKFANPVAIIEWGIGGVSQSAEVDFLNGTVINVCASWVRVSAYIDGPDPDTGRDSDTMPYTLSAFIGPGQPQDNNARKTVFTSQIQGTAALFPQYGEMKPIPLFASRATFRGARDPLVLDGIARKCYLFFYDNISGADGTVAGYLISDDNPLPFVVPNGAYYFRTAAITGNTEVIFGQVVFDLAL